VLAGILLFLCLLSGLRSRLRRAEGPEGGLPTLAIAAGPADAGLWVAAIAAFTAVSVAVEDESQFPVDPDSVRLIGAFGYLLFAAALTLTTALVGATSALALRAAALWRRRDRHDRRRTVNCR
jgi:hypothetical protein